MDEITSWKLLELCCERKAPDDILVQLKECPFPNLCPYNQGCYRKGNKKLYAVFINAGQRVCSDCERKKQHRRDQEKKYYREKKARKKGAKK